MKHTKQSSLLLIALIVALAAAVFGWLVFKPAPGPLATAERAAVPSLPSPPSLPSAPSLPAELQSRELPTPTQPLAANEIGPALTGFLGAGPVQNFFQLQDFPRRFVATVDNLARAHAPPMAWPINPTAGRFSVNAGAGDTSIGADNSLRYTPLVLLAESIHIGQAVELYVRMYPLLQQAYEELGFPKRKFNDRLLQVIDHLLATPAAAETVKVQLTEVKGPVEPLRPWVRYEFADPALESLSAGQKIMLRVGPVNQQRLKARLSAVRAEILKQTKSQ